MSNKNFKMGFAETDITPKDSIETIGFGREDNMSRGILHPLSAQVTVWELGDTVCCLITIDHIGFSKEHSNDLRDKVGDILRITREQVMLCFSHGHSSPNDDAAPKYYQMVCRKILTAVVRASHQRTYVKAGWGNGTVNIGVNRRADCTALDRRAGILKVCDAATGNLHLLLIRLTAHCNVLKADNWLISPDYFGTVRDVLQQEYHCPILVIQGAAGNIAPRYFKASYIPVDAPDQRFVRSDTALEDMAENVRRNILSVIKDIVPQEITNLSMYSRDICFTADVPSSELAGKIADEAKRYCGIDGTRWLQEIHRLHAEEITYQKDMTEVQYFLLGDGCLCGVANEVMVEFDLQILQRLGNEFFYFNGYTNGCTAYFPTEEEFDKGGYEVYWSMLHYFGYYGRVFPLKRNSASELIDFVVEQHQMNLL
ncbi:MAG: alkaline ceramidase [Clostridiales bacterium]|nr:alkaline ceramidase [Clostridiales bacterium]